MTSPNIASTTLTLIFGLFATALEGGTLPNPGWKVQVLLYEKVDLTFLEGGVQHHFVSSMVPSQIDLATNAAKKFFEVDVPALTSGAMRPVVTVTVISRSITPVSIGCGYWPDPNVVAPDLQPAKYDSAVVIWNDFGMDLTTNKFRSVGCYGGLTWPRGTGQTFTSFILNAFSSSQRNVFKHEWGHSILFYYHDAGKSPIPQVSNHINNTDTKYVHCHSGTSYVLVDDSDTNPIPNSVYYNLSGFTRDYYSGETATPDQPDRCLGISPSVWATGGPVTRPLTNPGNLNGDNQVDISDLALLMAALGQAASNPGDGRDLDYDGKITVLDARRLVTFCSKPGCAK